ncbi:uncharacterized protein LOC122997357 [Thunnus albacares]|uniref:uncharacterized protein LOC122997357 n=1 Tax=Thunnus albacares TaxID=8236 RepID=UPI001CF67165|nr:uncharacterized protein LOC122997357 [Thunnus albacares]
MSFIPHLILAGLIGIHCKIITVSRVSVKAGGSISIPCLYDQYYRNHVKYLCQGYYFALCHIVVDTNQGKSSSGKFSISDDTNQRIFTVTINDITHKDTDFWCAVEIVSGEDVKQYFQLSTGTSNLYVDQQEITAFEGGNVTINCHYKSPVERKWCRLGRTCVTNQFGSIDGTAVTIDASVSNDFTVTMSKLRTESSGWYWCAAGDLQMPVNVTVNESLSTTMSPSTARTLSTTHQHSSLLMSVEPCTAQPTNTTITGAGGESLQDEHKRSTTMTILITILVLQLLVVLTVFFGWRMIRCNKTKPRTSDITAVSQTGSDPNVLYATIVHAARKDQTPKDSVTYSTINKRDGAKQMVSQTGSDPDVLYANVVHEARKDQTLKDSVTYSTVNIRDGAKQMTEPEDGVVIYSTVGQHSNRMKKFEAQEVENQSLCLSSCSVLLSDMAAPLHFLLILTGLTGIHSLTTVKKVSVKLGSSISIPCLYSSKYKNHVKYLCEGYSWLSCSYAVKTNRKSGSEKFSISDDQNQGIFTVTIKDLTTKDSYYWCVVEIDGGADVGEYFQLSVTSGTPSLSVTHQKIMGFYGDEKTINCSNSITGVIKWCKLGRSCVSNQPGSIDGTNVTIVTGICNDRVTMSGLRIESSGWYLCVKGDFQMPVHLTVNEKSTTTKATAIVTATATTGHTQTLCCSTSNDAKSLIITLSLLIFIVMVALFICFLLKKHKQTKEDSSATTMAEEEVTYSTVNVKHKRKRSGQAVPDAIYGNVDNTRKASVQRPCAESDVNVIYTAVVTQKQQHV